MCNKKQSIENTHPIMVVAVHLGANNARCNKAHRDIAKSVCETVMKEAERRTNFDGTQRRQSIKTDSKQEVNTAVEAVVRAIELMEHEKSLNCGYGSNLNIEGRVECDASLMSSKGQVWTGIGSVSGCKSPIQLAKSLLDRYTNPSPIGLIQPNFLVASGARRWMRKHCPDLVVPDSYLISSRALERYQNAKSAHDSATKDLQASNLDGFETNCDQTSERHRLDTVGAVAVDCDNNFACAVSSGGIILKHQGRLGQAAVPGAGCWAQDSTAITTTGVGEYLTATLFARNFHEKLKTLKLLDQIGHPQVEPLKATNRNLTLIEEATIQSFRDFLDSPALSHVSPSERSAGMLTVSSFHSDSPAHSQGMVEDKGDDLDDGDSSLYLSYSHNTKSLCVGYMTASATEAEAILSCCDDDDEVKKDSCGISSKPDGFAFRTIKLDCRHTSSLI